MNSLPFLITKKFSLKKNKNYLIFLTSILSKIGVSISIFALIVSVSALNGFQVLLNKTILSNLPHGIMKFTDQSYFKWRSMIKKINILPGITYSEPYIVTKGLLVIKNQVKPIEIKSFSNIKHLKKKFFFHLKMIIF
ncbi:hypothetical protein [Buchnera aphidicola]|uniref:hypothetical protein n=1 Tax=Buchnera aphidicola TaxID=9 RepID=UPI0002E40A62|nr:hypothetical protein [Buchnera aphidicola]